MSKLPSFQFYPSDWLTDPALRSVSAEARGLWVDILCLMFNGERRGYLQINGLAPTVEQIARMCNATPEEVRRGFNELDKAAVFSKSADNVIFSRRMVKDEKIRRTRRVIGKLGGNPNFSAGKRNPYYEAKDKQKDNQGDYQKITLSSSSSSSYFKEKEIPLSGDKENPAPKFYNPISHPPTIGDVKKVAEGFGLVFSDAEAQEFLDWHISRGWEINKTLIRDWRPRVRTWKERGRDMKPVAKQNQQAQRIRAEDYKGEF